jgi:type IV secretion system protein VirD4
MAFYSKSEKERSGVISTGRRHLHFLGYPRMQKVLQDGPFDLGLLQRERATLYLSLPAMMMGSCAGWLRLFVNLTLNAFEANKNRRDFQHQKGGDRVLMVLDEAAVLGRMERLEVAIGQIAGLGVKLRPIWQDLNQPAAIYGKRWESFLGNASVLTFFGNNDQFTLDYIEKRLGQTLVYSPAHRTPTLDAAINHGELGQSFTVQPHPLLNAAEIAEIFDRDDPLLRQLVFLPRIGPVILQRAFYDQHETFRRLHAKA